MNKYLLLIPFLLITFFNHSPALARKFDFKSEFVSMYFRGTYGTSSVADSPYAGSSGNDVSVDKSVSSNYSGELGFTASGTFMALRIGAEYLMPRHYSDIYGTDTSGTRLFTLDSKLVGVIPNASVEFFPYSNSTSRVIMGAGYGIAYVSLDNTYTMTTDGETKFGFGSFIESSSTRVDMFQAYVGYEILFTDTVTATVDLGYRRLLVPELKATKSGQTIVGSIQENDIMTNHDGSNRTANMSGPFVGLAFKFYIGI